MSQSKKFWLLFVLSALVYALIFAWEILPYIPKTSGDGFSYDAVKTYSKIIENEKVTNWHSSLFMYECIAIKRLVWFACGYNISGFVVLYVVFWGTTLGMLMSNFVIFYYLTRENSVFFLLFPFFAFILRPMFFRMSIIGLDYFFVGILWLFVTSLFLHYVSEKRGRRKILTFVVLFFLIHLVSYRKQAIVLVPFVVAYLLCMMPLFCKLKMRWKLSVWFVSVVAMACVSMKNIDFVLPVEKRHPVVPMMESDIRIALILQGRQNEWQEKALIRNPNHEAANTICAYWVGLPKQEQGWNEFKAEYIRQWKEQPSHMLAACLIQRIQFYMGGHNLPFLTRTVEKYYPAVKRNEYAWIKNIVPTVHRPLHRLFVLCMAPLAFLVGIIAYRKKWIRPFAAFFVIVTAGISVAYTCSYLIVTPTCDGRFLVPSHVMALYSIATLLICLLVTGYSKVQKRVICHK